MDSPGKYQTVGNSWWGSDGYGVTYPQHVFMHGMGSSSLPFACPISYRQSWTHSCSTVFYTMGLGILEPTTTVHVPGTVLLDQQAAHSGAITAGLKHGTGANANIVLAPQPSEDPNDPLNWSPMKRLRILIITCFGVIIHGVVPVSHGPKPKS